MASRRFIETGKPILSVHLRSPSAYVPILPSIRISASPGQPLQAPPLTQVGRNPQEFHFVCQANYTPEFYIRVRPSFTVHQRRSMYVLCDLSYLYTLETYPCP
ncbi:hypothetical protein WN55_04803 [Dufourea novaeangliae]|uniref:Uncharacterized protein n=1 Tax=Dufourea novaeangliae TaxID=178035 RepID=A0A154PLG5_DUFNO|nr:hypothetical protein WN55_04803 [Dufourea novaeangliae]